MSSDNKIPLILIGLFILGGLLYWLVLRPDQIRKECYEYAYGTPNLGDTKEWNEATEYYYEACLHRNGL